MDTSGWIVSSDLISTLINFIRLPAYSIPMKNVMFLN